MKTKQQVVSEFRRAEILASARTVFARVGFEGGIMDEIAREAGLAKGTLYLYFRNKTDIYKAVLDHDMKSLKESTLERLGAATGLKNKIQAFIVARLERAETNREFFRIMDSDARFLNYSRSQYRDWLREPVMHLAEAIKAAVKTGEIPAVDPEKNAWLIVDVTRGTIQRSYMASAPEPPLRDANFLLNFIWAGLTAGSKPRKRSQRAR